MTLEEIATTFFQKEMNQIEVHDNSLFLFLKSFATYDAVSAIIKKEVPDIDAPKVAMAWMICMHMHNPYVYLPFRTESDLWQILARQLGDLNVGTTRSANQVRLHMSLLTFTQFHRGAVTSILKQELAFWSKEGASGGMGFADGSEGLLPPPSGIFGS